MQQFPYAANDRLYGALLALDLSSNPGATPPHSAHSNSTLGKLWLDTSVGPPQLRVCAVAQAQAAYVASDWFNLGPVTGGGSSALTYMPLAGDSTKAGSLVVSTNLTVGGFTSLNGISAINLTLNGGSGSALNVTSGGITVAGGVNGHTFNPWGITYPSFEGHAIGFGWNGANLVAHVDGTANPGALATVSQLGGYLLLAGGTITGGLTINGGSTALYVPNGNIATNGTLTVAQTGYFGGDVTIHGGGTQALYVDNGGIRATSLQADGGGIVVNATSGDIRAAGVFQGQYLHGGVGDAGVLRMYNTNDTICFRWDGSNVFYRMDETVDQRIPWAQGIQGFAPVSDGGSPTGQSISFQYTPGGGYLVHIDTVSDERLKTNIRDTDVDALAVILAIPVRAFEWNDLGQEYMPNVDPEVPIGFVAQEVEAVAPFMVGITAEPDPSAKAGDLPTDLHKIIQEHLPPYFVRAIQQLEARVKILEGV